LQKSTKVVDLIPLSGESSCIFTQIFLSGNLSHELVFKQHTLCVHIFYFQWFEVRVGLFVLLILVEWLNITISTFCS
jgi:hypothetical protein